MKLPKIIDTLTEGVVQSMQDWKLQRMLDEEIRLEKQSYVQAAMPVFMKALDLTPSECVEYMRDYEGDLWDLLVYPNSLQVRWNFLDKDRDNRFKIVPYDCEPKVDRKDLILGARNQYKGSLAVDVIEKLQGVELRLDRQIFEEFSPRSPIPNENKVYGEFLSKPFYFKWRFDKRGRFYSEGYSIQLQGETYRREIITLGQSVAITPQGRVELYRQLGMEGSDVPITFSQAEKLGRKRYRDGIAEMSIKDTKLVEALNSKSSPVLVGVDAAASNIQIMSCLMGCEKGMKLTNAKGKGNTRVHKHIMDLMNKQLMPKDQLGLEDIKEVLKPSIMTHYFNSISTPKSLFSKTQLAAFYDALDGLLPGAELFMETVNAAWDDYNFYEWTMLDGHNVHIKRFVNKTLEAEIEDIKFDYDYRVQGKDDNYRHLVANVVHSMDAWIAREMVRRCNFDLLVIHDNFMCHPNDIETVKSKYREVLSDAVMQDMLGQILTQLTGSKVEILEPERREEVSSMILNSVHTLC